MATLGLVYGGVRWCPGGVRAVYAALARWPPQPPAHAIPRQARLGASRLKHSAGQRAICSACPAANYRRLSRYDETGLIWLLHGRPVIVLTETEAAIQGATAVLIYRKQRKPALGPIGDSLDDMWGSRP